MNDNGYTNQPMNGTMGPQVSLQATKTMCFYCFDVLIETLQDPSRSKTKNKIDIFASELPDVTIECPLFVTWDKTNAPESRNPKFQLRGCIGTLSARLLVDAVGEYAVISALKDRRFRPIQLSEIPFLRVAVSLLVNYEKCEDAYDWEVGIHGIMIDFVVDKQSYSATYLPEVAKEQGWTIQQTIESLIQKAGYRGAIHPTLLRNIQCTRYQSSKCRVTFREYLAIHCEGKEPFAAGLIPEAQRSRLSACQQM